jgi:PPOX class probable F420-dependent enzyme
MVAPSPLAALDRQQYVSLTTFRRDGTAVPTPVWFAVDGDTIVVTTEASAGKVKRIRNNADVSLVPCDARGRTKPGAAPHQGTALLIDGDDAERADTVLSRKYGLVWKAFGLGSGLWRLVRRQAKSPSAHLAITLAHD